MCSTGAPTSHDNGWRVRWGHGLSWAQNLLNVNVWLTKSILRVLFALSLHWVYLLCTWCSLISNKIYYFWKKKKGAGCFDQMSCTFILRDPISIAVIGNHIFKISLFKLIQTRFRQRLSQFIWWLCQVDHGKSKFCFPMFILHASCQEIIILFWVLSSDSMYLDMLRMRMEGTVLQFNWQMRNTGMILLSLLQWYVYLFSFLLFCEYIKVF